MVLTKRNKLCAVDVKLFAVSHNYPGARCTVHPLKFEISPDGEHIIEKVKQLRKSKRNVFTSFTEIENIILFLGERDWNSKYIMRNC